MTVDKVIPMKFVELLIRLLPVAILSTLALVAFVVGSYAVMDMLVHNNAGDCILVGASTELCLVPVTSQAEY